MMIKYHKNSFKGNKIIRSSKKNPTGHFKKSRCTIYPQINVNNNNKNN